ncbi:MAG: hypothetical protein K0S80_3917 [Neobacillus sp.]|nr:hypothetical protein [Neobacillus sp.]
MRRLQEEVKKEGVKNGNNNTRKSKDSPKHKQGK